MAKLQQIATLVFTVGLLVVAVLGFQLYQRSGRFDMRISQLEHEFQRAEKNASESAEVSRSAMARAAEAEKNARLAALGKTEAEEAGAQAAAQSEQDRQRAEAATQEAQLAREEVDQMRQRREVELERLQKALGTIADTERTALGLVMTLGSDSIKFEFDEAILRPPDRELLSRIAGVLLTTYGMRIQIFGHTDDVGSDEYNKLLSERRAQAVRDYLVEAGVSPDLMMTKGFGKSSPRALGTSTEMRAKNRRVEIGIVDSIINYQGEAAARTSNQ